MTSGKHHGCMTSYRRRLRNIAGVPIEVALWFCMMCGVGFAQQADQFSQSATDSSSTSGPLSPTDPQAAATDPPRHWRATWLHDPCTMITLSWNTETAGDGHKVRLRQAGTDQFVEFPAEVNDSFSFAEKVEMSLHYHRVTLSGLAADTRYDVEFESNGLRSPPFYFVTAPTGDSPFSLLFGGDSRSDQKKRLAMNRLMARLVAQGAASPDRRDRIVGLMHAGDYVGSGTNLKQWCQWMADHEQTVSPDGRLLVVIPARGNHDRGRLFCETFGFETRDVHNWFGLRFGSQLGVITLNTEASIAGDQAKWLRTELTAARRECRWLVAQYHRPGYAATKWPSGALMHWVPLFEQFNVDLVCEGDGHTIKRTVPIRGGKYDPDGVVYIGEGGLGVPPRSPKPRRWYLKEPGMCDQGYHVHRLSFDSDRLTCECILLDESVRDRWQSTRPSAVPSAQPTP